jgi:8-oxo-dGTP pyrophosphatase MutT (NUDIX family)
VIGAHPPPDRRKRELRGLFHVFATGQRNDTGALGCGRRDEFLRDHCHPFGGSSRAAGSDFYQAQRKAPHVAAAREAREEAGVVGRISRRPIGWFSYKKRLKRGIIVVCTVHVFALKVKRQKEHWPEKDQREGQWMSRTKAAKSVGDPMLGNLIAR